MLLRFPPHHLRSIAFLHAVDLNLLDDHVSTAHGNHHTLLLDAGKQTPDRFGHHRMVHHLSLYDGIGQNRRRRNTGQLRLTAAVVYDHDLDEPAANV